MFKHAFIAAAVAVAALGGVATAFAGDSDSDRRSGLGGDASARRHGEVTQRLDGHDRDSAHRFGRRPVYPHAPQRHWRDWRHAGHGHPSHHDRHPGYHCRYCHYRTGSRGAFFDHMHHHHHVPWHRVGAHLAWHPLHFFFAFDGH